MANPRSTSTRRAILSYDHYKELYKGIGIVLPDLLVKDYQGIYQDFIFTSDEIDGLELRVIQNEEDIDALEARILRTIKTTESITAEAFQVILCDNITPIDITLDPAAVKDDMIHVVRRNEEVTTIGLINGLNDRIINVKYWSELYIFDGTEWSVI